jgi:hypothetical protein
VSIQAGSDIGAERWRLESAPFARRARTVNIVVNEDLKTSIDRLTPQECGALERGILAEGCRDELKQAAKRARDGGRQSRDMTRDTADAPPPEADPRVRALQDRVAALTAENEYLRGQLAELQARRMA